MRIFLLLIALLALTAGCAPTLTNLQKSEQAYNQAQEASKANEARMAEAKRLADEAKRKAEEAGKAHGRVIVDDARTKVELATQLSQQAEEQRRKACTFDPTLCAPSLGTTLPPIAGPTALRPGFDYLDVQIDNFGLSGIRRLTPMPVGWSINVEAEKAITLSVNGTPAMTFTKPNPWAPGCYRFTSSSVGPCPTPAP